MSLVYRHAHMSLTEEHWLDTSLNKILILKRIKSTLDSTIISHIAYILSKNSNMALNLAEILIADEIYINLMLKMSNLNRRIHGIEYLIYKYKTMYRKNPLTRRRRYLYIEDLKASTCKNRFRFRQADLISLRKELEIPDIVRVNDKHLFSGDEILLAGLWRLSNKGTLEAFVDLMKDGRDFSQWSRAINYFIKHVYVKFIHVLEGSNMERYISQFENFAKCIRERIYYVSSGELNEENYACVESYANIIGYSLTHSLTHSLLLTHSLTGVINQDETITHSLTYSLHLTYLLTHSKQVSWTVWL